MAASKSPRPNTLASLKKAKLVVKCSDEDDLSELIQDEDIRGCVSVDEAYVHDGPLTLDGDLDLFLGAVLIVKGDLTVSQGVTTDETATLVVTGRLGCRHLLLEGNLEVQRGATISGALFGFYEAGISRIFGTAKAKVALLGNHEFEADREDFKTVARFANNQRLHEGDPVALRKVLGEEAFAGLSPLLGLPGGKDVGNDAWSMKLLRHL